MGSALKIGGAGIYASVSYTLGSGVVAGRQVLSNGGWEHMYDEEEEDYEAFLADSSKCLSLIFSLDEVAMLCAAAAEILPGTENDGRLEGLIGRLEDVLCREERVVSLDLDGDDLLFLHRAAFTVFARSRAYPDFTKLAPQQIAVIGSKAALGDLAAALESHLEDLGLVPATVPEL